ncbi:MAG: hypothetical protein RMJ59_07515 [Candidatus Nitrosocaldus sp.]|nr:hypothetical protein [Candidatus Nitrosocaldus sp.]
MMVYGATNCTATYGEDCYAVGGYDFTVQSLGAGVKQKVPYPSNMIGYMVSPLWITLENGRLLEIGWIASASYTPRWYWALDGIIQRTWCTNNTCPSNNSMWIFTIHDANTDQRLTLRVGTDRITTTERLGSTSARNTSAGYEIGYYDTNPGINEYKDFMYYKPNTGWMYISSNAASQWYYINPVNGYAVDYCNNAYNHFMVAKGGGRNLC